MKKVDLFYNCIEEAVLLLYEILNYNYLDILYRVSCDLNSEINETSLDQDVIIKLNSIYDKISGVEFSALEIKQAFLLLLTNAFKELDISLDLMTPDSVARIFSQIINTYYDKDLKMLDVQLGTGNLSFNIVLNYLSDIENYGVETSPLLIKVAQTYANFIKQDVNIFHQNTLDFFGLNLDLIVGDIETFEVDKHLYKDRLDDIDYSTFYIFENYINVLEEDGLFIFLISNTFFSNPDFKKFKKIIENKILLAGLIVLPLNLFKDEKNSKSILICKKTSMTADMQVVYLDSLNNDENDKQVQSLINSIKKKGNK